MKLDYSSHSDLNFGTIAIEKEYVLAGEVNEALKMQKREEDEGFAPRPLRVILMDVGLMTIEQVKAVREELRQKRII